MSVGTNTKSDAPGRLDAFHRLVGHLRRRVVEQRDQQPAEARVGDLTDRGGDVAASGARSVARIAGELDEHGLGGVHVRRRGAGGERHGRGHADARIRIGEQRPGQRRRILVVDGAERDDRGRPDAGIRVAQHAPHLRQPSHAMSLRTAPSARSARCRTVGDSW